MDLGRETFLVTVDWEDDWPVFNEGKNVTLKTKGRSSMGSVSTNALHTWQADLSKATLELGWYQKSKLSFIWREMSTKIIQILP